MDNVKKTRFSKYSYPSANRGEVGEWVVTPPLEGVEYSHSKPKTVFIKDVI